MGLQKRKAETEWGAEWFIMTCRRTLGSTLDCARNHNYGSQAYRRQIHFSDSLWFYSALRLLKGELGEMSVDSLRFTRLDKDKVEAMYRFASQLNGKFWAICDELLRFTGLLKGKELCVITHYGLQVYWRASYEWCVMIYYGLQIFWRASYEWCVMIYYDLQIFWRAC